MNLKSASGAVIPEDLVTVGYVTGAYGLNGWVKVKPFSADADALLIAKTWWLDKPELRDVTMLQSKTHSGEVVASLMGVADRNAAEALKGATVQIPRSHFPALDDGEFYWIDLIGSAVENMQGEQIGTIADMMDNGAHPIMRIERQGPDANDATKMRSQEILIPFVGHFVKTVDQVQKKITVDWALDY